MIVNEGGGGKKLPTLTNPASTSDVASGKQYIDQDGELRSGVVTVRDSSTGISFGPFASPYQSGSSFVFSHTYPTGFSNVLLRPGVQISAQIPSSLFGTATAADVVMGKTFTSVDGLMVQGTRAPVNAGMQQFTSVGSPNASFPYPFDSIPFMLFITRNDGIAMEDSSLFTLSYYGTYANYTLSDGRGIIEKEDISVGSVGTADKLSFYKNGDQLHIQLPYRYENYYRFEYEGVYDVVYLYL